MMLGNKARLRISGVNVLDVENGRTLRDAEILIEQDRILDVGRLLNASADVAIAAHGLWAIPSLVDMHAHVTFEGRSHLRSAPNSEGREMIRIARGAQNLNEALCAGICLIRDAGDEGGTSLILKQLVDEDSIVGPELVLSGQPVCCPGGHGYEFSRPLVKEENIRSLIANHRSQGYEWLKVMNGPELHELSDMKQISYWAHEYGLKVMCHSFTEDGIRAAIISGMDTVEHGLVFNQETLTEAQSRATTFVPTCYSAVTSLRPEYVSTIPRAELEYLQKWYDFLQDHFAFNILNGVIMAVGTDGGAAPSTVSDVLNEVKRLCYHGMKPVDAIRSATIVPARVLGKANDFGAVARGKLANIILLSDDPTLQINALDSIVAVFYRGARIIQREVAAGTTSPDTRTLGAN